MCPAACELVNRHFLCFSSEPDTTAASPLTSPISSDLPPSNPPSLSPLSRWACPAHLVTTFSWFLLPFAWLFSKWSRWDTCTRCPGPIGAQVCTGVVWQWSKGGRGTLSLPRAVVKIKIKWNLCVMFAFSHWVCSPNSLSTSLTLSLACPLFHSTAFYVHSAVAAYVMGAYGSLVPITNDRNYIQIDSQIGSEQCGVL